MLAGKNKKTEQKNHARLGRDLGIYMVSDLVGPGLPLYLPAGGVVVSEIENFMRTLQTKMGYSPVFTPHIAKSDLFKKSGHLQWFADGMYPPMKFAGEGEYYAKPMSCPFHILIYQEKPRSFRDLPIRYAEFGTVYRYEQSGEINGLVRTRGFTQDDAHIFCREDQVVSEFIKVFELTDKLLSALGLTDHWHRLSLPGKDNKKYAGNKKQWESAVALIKKALKQAKIDYKEALGEAAFYGPKLDILFRDSMGREWQLSTIQVDFLLPERFDLSYTDQSGKKKRPYMIHRAPLGSRERVMAILLEHFNGAFPLWLSPVQIKILPITDQNVDYAKKIYATLSTTGIRVEIDDRNETLDAKIRDAQVAKIPYMIVVGKKEEQENVLSVRARNGEVKQNVKIEEFIFKIKKDVEEKSFL